MRLKFLPSFVKRRGRITKKQEENLKNLPIFTVEDMNDLKEECTKFSSCCLEIGFGNAENISQQALSNPEVLFIGSEVYMSGIGTLLGNIKDSNINNVRIFPDDIRILLDKNSIEIFDAIKIICPDPWPKERHHKRRLLNKDFFERIQSCLKPNSFIFLSTDWKNYAEQIQDVLRGFEDKFYIETIKQIPGRELSKFQKKGIKEGREIYNFKLSLI
mgnify:CR=1 FL=1